MEESRRIDKWLWEVRLFKTRNQADRACRGGKVRLGERPVKPSHELHPGDRITLQLGPLVKTVRVNGFPRCRVGARLVQDFAEDLTPKESYQQLHLIRETNFEYRERGAGRPTKRQRKEIETLKKRWKD